MSVDEMIDNQRSKEEVETLIKSMTRLHVVMFLSKVSTVILLILINNAGYFSLSLLIFVCIFTGIISNITHMYVMRKLKNPVPITKLLMLILYVRFSTIGIFFICFLCIILTPLGRKYL